MIINKTRIVNVESYLTAVPVGTAFRIISDASSVRSGLLTRLGFSAPPVDGEMILPTGIGPVSRYNANGKWRVRRDLPKERRYIRTVQWTRRQWAGRGNVTEITDFRDIHMDCYPRELIPPPSLELTYSVNDDRQLIMSADFLNTEQMSPLNKHAVNLFLELFGSCEIVTQNLVSFNPPELKHANWRMLPPGEYPWARLEEHVSRAVSRRSAGTRAVIMDRQNTVREHGPSEIFVGNGGFDDYLAYVFRDRGLVVLESIRSGNAIYVFGMDWNKVSQLTKAQILADNLQLHRIVHTEGWKKRLAQVLAPRTPPPAAKMSV